MIDMSIDEAIEKERKQVEMFISEYVCDCEYYGKDFIDDYADDLDYIKNMHEHEQIAEWLEELKVYQQHEVICNKGYNSGYNKAIDDFAEKMKYEYGSDEIHETIDDIAEQLKAGGKNE